MSLKFYLQRHLNSAHFTSTFLFPVDEYTECKIVSCVSGHHFRTSSMQLFFVHINQIFTLQPPTATAVHQLQVQTVETEHVTCIPKNSADVNHERHWLVDRVVARLLFVFQTAIFF